jgi:hypothetical protein
MVHLQIALAEKGNREKGVSDTSDGEVSQEECSPFYMMIICWQLTYLDQRCNS